jgi:hypothetical protein
MEADTNSKNRPSVETPQLISRILNLGVDVAGIADLRLLRGLPLESGKSASLFEAICGGRPAKSE